MTTSPLTASVVERDSILETLEQHLRWGYAYRSFLKRLRAKAQKGAITAADLEAYQRRSRLQEQRQEVFESQIGTRTPDISAVKADATPDASTGRLIESPA
jgi:hypothetical protein